MTIKELKEALANVPDDAEVYMDDCCSVNGVFVNHTEYDEYNNVFIIA
jgi:hypothetical protein